MADTSTTQTFEELSELAKLRFPGLELEIPGILQGLSYSPPIPHDAAPPYSGTVQIPSDQYSDLPVTFELKIEESATGGYEAEFVGSIKVGSTRLEVRFSDESKTLAAYGILSESLPSDEVDSFTKSLGLSDVQLPSALAMPVEAKVAFVLSLDAQDSHTKLLKVTLIAADSQRSPFVLPVLNVPLLATPQLNLFVASKNLNESAMEGFQELLPKGYELPTEPPSDNALNQVGRKNLTATGKEGGKEMVRKKTTSATFVLTKGLSVYVTLFGDIDSGMNYVCELGGTTDGNTFWHDVDQSIGFINLDSIGMVADNNSIGLVFEATVRLTALLEFSVSGMGLQLEWSKHDWKFIPPYAYGCELSKGTFDLAGAFALLPDGGRQKGTSAEALGSFMLRFQSYGVGAMGCYAWLEGADEPSGFILLNIAFPEQDPIVSITGIVGGVGLNNRILVPTVVTGSSSFPFLSWLENQQYPAKKQGVLPDDKPAETPSRKLGEPASSAATKTDDSWRIKHTPLQCLLDLTSSQPAWVTPVAGSFWVCAGMQLTLLEEIKSTGIVTVQWLPDLTLSYLAMSTLLLPGHGAPEDFLYVESLGQIMWKPTSGFISRQEALSPNSFIISSECNVMGGYMVALWLPPSDHAGDFVLSIGGFNPLYKKPARYPAPMRVRYSWGLGHGIVLTGSCYAALVPSAVMAGFEINEHFHAGPLRAWFQAHADFLVEWMPFAFDASIGIEVGVSLKIDAVIVHKTIKLELGADLEVWGVPTGGKVELKVLFTSMQFEFGAKAASEPATVTWEHFAGLLGKKSFHCQAVGGLVATTPSENPAFQGQEDWVLRPNGAKLTVTSTVPCTDINGEAALPGLDIRPMDLTGASSPLTVTLQAVDPETGQLTTVDLAGTGWAVETITKRAPSARWGKPVDKKHPSQLLNDESLIPMPVGVALTAPKAEQSDDAESADLANYEYAVLEVDRVPEDQGASVPTLVSGKGLQAIVETLEQPGNVAARAKLFSDLDALGLDPGHNDDMADYLADIDELFTGQPMVCAAPSPV